MLKVIGHGAKRSGRLDNDNIVNDNIVIELWRDDSVVQDIASTTEASLRDAEGIEQSLAVHSASLHTRL